MIDRYYQYQSLYLRLLAENELKSPVDPSTSVSVTQGLDQRETRPVQLEERLPRKYKLPGLPVSIGDSQCYSCSRCGNSYGRLHSLNRHIRFECGVEPQFECPVCHKRSKHKHNLVLHMRTHQKP